MEPSPQSDSARTYDEFAFAKIVFSVAFQSEIFNPCSITKISPTHRPNGIGVQVFLVIYASSTFLETPRDQRWGRLCFIMTSWGILVLSSMSTVIVLILNFKTYRNPSYTHFSTSDWHISSLANTTHALVVAAGDFLMVWRCFTLWENRKWVLILPSLTGLGSSGDYFLLRSENQILNIEESLHLENAWLAAICLSVSTNIMTTCLILFPLAQTWWVMSRALAVQKTSSMYSNVTAIIIESAAPLAISGIGCLILHSLLVDPNWVKLNISGDMDRALVRRYGILQAGMDMFSLLYVSFSALSPQMIIFRVTTGRSWANASDFNDGTGALSRPLEFGCTTTDSGTRGSEIKESV
ncbi:hypothetical protein BKA70DRAFT_1098308 [Coprinopsis sp. MPI-PUGE-AT-0042]|nr:hypothetical protein BKA70DRAFT_1098308 [Coprinopsis sp. MPI-PUGE-AT-0042]